MLRRVCRPGGSRRDRRARDRRRRPDDPRPGRFPRDRGVRGRGHRAAELRRERGAMTGLVWQPSIPPQAGRDGPGRSSVRRRRDRWWTAPLAQGTLFTICATAPVHQRDHLDMPLYGWPTWTTGACHFLAVDQARVATDVDQPRPVHPVDPARFPRHLLLLPEGLLPLLFRRSARLRGRRAEVHHGYRLENAFPFILQNVHRYFLYLAFIPLFFL